LAHYDLPRITKLVEEELRKITSKRLRFIGWLQNRAVMEHISTWALCATMALALLKTKAQAILPNSRPHVTCSKKARENEAKVARMARTTLRTQRARSLRPPL
jgi:hypothetical protein